MDMKDVINIYLEMGSPRERIYTGILGAGIGLRFLNIPHQTDRHLPHYQAYPVMNSVVNPVIPQIWIETKHPLEEFHRMGSMARWELTPMAR